MAQNQEVPELEIAVDRQKAADVGLTAHDVLLQAAAALGGESASLRGLKQGSRAATRPSFWKAGPV